MGKQALGAFERQPNGDWACIKDVDISVAPGSISGTAPASTTVHVWKGRRFSPHTVFAGFDDFTAYLESICVESPSITPHG